MELLAHLLQHKIIAIVRGAPPEQMRDLVQALYVGGIRSLEITINSPQALALIAQTAREMEGKMFIGAGTVLDPETARAALLAGATFIVSPTFNPETIATTKRYGAVSIPGAMTPTEILNAYTAGGDIIKVFPATLGPSFFREMSGPLPHIPLAPTGGVTIDTIQAFYKAGARAFGIGSALTKIPEDINEGWQDFVTRRAKEFVAALK